MGIYSFIPSEHTINEQFRKVAFFTGDLSDLINVLIWRPKFGESDLLRVFLTIFILLALSGAGPQVPARRVQTTVPVAELPSSEVKPELPKLLGKIEKDPFDKRKFLLELKQKGFDAQRRGNVVTIRLKTDLIIDHDYGGLSEYGQGVLKAYSNKLNQYPVKEVHVEGFTDSWGEILDNLAVSQSRAEIVLEELKGNGVSAKTFRAIGRGEAFPVSTNNLDAGRAKNRRIEIVVR